MQIDQGYPILRPGFRFGVQPMAHMMPDADERKFIEKLFDKVKSFPYGSQVNICNQDKTNGGQILIEGKGGEVENLTINLLGRLSFDLSLTGQISGPLVQHPGDMGACQKAFEALKLIEKAIVEQRLVYS